MIERTSEALESRKCFEEARVRREGRIFQAAPADVEDGDLFPDIRDLRNFVGLGSGLAMARARAIGFRV